MSETLTIETLSHDLRGIARLNGKVVFVSGGLPTETVRWVPGRRKNRWMEGHVSSVLTTHPDRVQPICKKADLLLDAYSCGGCTLQHMSHDLQLSAKQNTLLEVLPATLPNAVHEPIASQRTDYRRKARLGVYYDKKAAKVYVGFREARSHFITQIAQCPVLDQRVGCYLSDIAQAIERTTVKDAIPQIEVAITDVACALVVRHLRALTDTDTHTLIAVCEQRNWQLWLQPAGIDSAHRIYAAGSTELLLYYELKGFGIRLFFHPLDFTQVNYEVNQALVKRAVEWLDLTPNDTVFDVFSGIGNFTLALAQRAGSVTAIDGEKRLIERLQYNVTYNQQLTTVYPNALAMAHIEAHSMTLLPGKDIDAFAQLVARKAPRAVLLDPPRTGCEPVMACLHTQPSIEKILYVSCNSHTLARDASILTAHGFEIVKVAIADMFTHTNHVENICLFVRSNS